MAAEDSQNEPREPRRRAVALRYDAERDDAPKIVAKGAGHLAERILQTAAEHGLPVQEDPDLVELLAKVDVQMEIPEELYRAVAEVLAFVYRLNRAEYARRTPQA